MIVGLFTKLLSPGGVERISQHTAIILKLFGDEKNLSCKFLTLNDSRGMHNLNIGTHECTFKGFGGNKLSFIFELIKLIPKINLLCIGHPDFASLGVLAKLLNRNLVYFVVTYGIDVWESLPFLSQRGLQNANFVTALSNYTGRQLQKIQRVNYKKIIVLPPALDPFFLKNGCFNSNKEELGVKKDKILLTVARLDSREKYKGIDTVIEALPLVLKEAPDVTYVIVGDGNDKERLKNIAEHRRVANKVKFEGNKFGEELSSYYKNCDVFVMPSLKEGFGVVFLEAMAFGKPVIGCTSGGIPDVVIDNVTGYLIDFGNSQKLAEKIILLLKNVTLCDQMGKAGQKRVNENFSFEQYHSRLTEILKGEKLCMS